MPCWIAVCLTGCSGAVHTSIRSPVRSQCNVDGLRNCDAIAEGTSLFANGSPTDGATRLGQGLDANQERTDDLLRFADNLQLMSLVLESGMYAASLQPAVQLIRYAAANATSNKAPAQALDENYSLDQCLLKIAEHQRIAPLFRPFATDPGAAPDVPGPSVSKVWMVFGNSLASTCKSAELPKMKCLEEVVEMPKIVTDVLVSSTCPVDIVVSSRVEHDFDWFVYAPAGKGANVLGASLPLGAKHVMAVAIGPSIPRNEDVTTVWHDLRNPSIPVGDKTPEEKAIDAIPDPPVRMLNPYH
jgi:hypothetical protein